MFELMRRALSLLVLAVALLPCAVSADLVNSYFFIPVVTNAPGVNNTFWKSDVTVTNLGPSAVLVGLKYFPSDVANTFDGTFPVTSWCQSGQTSLFEDVLGQYFPSAGQGKGFMVVADVTSVNCNVASPPTSHPGLLAVTSRTYNTGDPKGTYSLSADMNLLALNWTTYPSVMPGIRHTGTAAPGYRTNLSVANFSTVRIRVLVRIYDSTGALAAPESPQTIEALSFKQWSLPNLGVSYLSGAGRIEVRLDPVLVANPCTSVTDTFCTNPCDSKACPTKYAMRSTPTFFAYASMTDNGTGDGTMVSSFIDWQGYSKYTTDYKNAHCPGSSTPFGQALGEWMRDKGPSASEPPPTFSKVKK